MSGQQKLIVVHTNDIHSHFEQMPKIKTALDAARRNYAADELLIVDIGDHMDRVRTETEGSEGLANVAVMNESGYEFAVPGNNEGLTFSPEQLLRAYREASFTVIASNLRYGRTGEVPGPMVPWHVASKGGLRIGLIGVTAYFPAFYELMGWQIDEPFAVVGELVRQLRPQCEVLIVLSHLGLGFDKQMAAEIGGIDLILGGHTHHLLEQPLQIGTTYIAGAGKFGTHIGEIELEYDWEQRKVSVLSGRCLSAESFFPSPSLEETILSWRLLARQNLSRSVAEVPHPLRIDWRRESEGGNLLAAGVRNWVEAEIGIVNSGQLLNSLLTGSVTQEQLLEMCPSPINPCKMKLRGDRIRLALEESLLPEYIDKPIRGFGFRGEQLGTLSVDGLRIEVDHQRRPLQKIVGLWVNGEPLVPEREYVVGTLDIFTFGIGYLSLREGRDIEFYLPDFIRDVLARQLRDPQELLKCRQARWIDVRS